MSRHHRNIVLSVSILAAVAACQVPPFITRLSPPMTARSPAVTARPGAPATSTTAITSEPGSAEPSLPAPVSTMVPEPDTGTAGDETHQWAASVSATSQLDDAHSAAQAAGDPGVEACDFDGHGFKLQPNAWTSAAENTVEILTATYAVPVVPTRINIHQVVVPNAVTRVNVVDITGAEHTVYSGAPYEIDFCPYIMQIDVQGVTAKIQTVIITLDQSVLGKRNEINAVELVGRP